MKTENVNHEKRAEKLKKVEKFLFEELFHFQQLANFLYAAKKFCSRFDLNFINILMRFILLVLCHLSTQDS